jgi:hypothetical protein
VSALPFEFWWYAGWEKARFDMTTPVTIIMYHNFVSGQWVNISDATAPGVNGLWKITVFSELVFGLVGTTSPGVAGDCIVRTYIPRAVFQSSEEGIIDAPVKLIGPESGNTNLVGQPGTTSRGRFSMSIGIREIF